MPVIHRTVATLRISGDDLNPEVISKLLKGLPTSRQKKGEETGEKGEDRIAKFGMWRVEATDKHPGDEEAQIKEILDQLSNDLSAGRKITEEYECDMFFGLFLEDLNEGYSLKPSTLLALGSRGIDLKLDIYAPC